MPRYRRSQTPGARYFFTVVTYRRRAILCDEPMRAALREAIAPTRRNHPFTIDGWVLMPDHLLKILERLGCRADKLQRHPPVDFEMADKRKIMVGF